jgi:hypothetical protein
MDKCIAGIAAHLAVVAPELVAGRLPPSLPLHFCTCHRDPSTAHDACRPLFPCIFARATEIRVLPTTSVVLWHTPAQLLNKSNQLSSGLTTVSATHVSTPPRVCRLHCYTHVRTRLPCCNALWRVTSGSPATPSHCHSRTHHSPGLILHSATSACVMMLLCHLKDSSPPPPPTPCYSPAHQVSSCGSPSPQALHFSPGLQLAKLVTQLRGDHLSS